MKHRRAGVVPGMPFLMALRERHRPGVGAWGRRPAVGVPRLRQPDLDASAHPPPSSSHPVAPEYYKREKYRSTISAPGLAAVLLPHGGDKGRRHARHEAPQRGPRPGGLYPASGPVELAENWGLGVRCPPPTRGGRGRDPCIRKNFATVCDVRNLAAPRPLHAGRRPRITENRRGDGRAR